ncbi:RNA 2',3'-cyclic phosphodiesterase [Methanotorris igneus]|uniref:RNA 2',3'-cyclic phosphodiesterase n=1 Tax=Methanotorris igneus (strain DSM 5666 / JCM 11834 / Kol 5) TaxID=880724 RepID=F6BBB5_METIK|nr:RNA 2',3'-cyclic phosphodiesterase [Methanotorris igneus]AEF97122.1 2'-5' RNA ligase [Methanotorris igneus Kol 5]
MRCFIAIDLPEEIKDKIEEVKKHFKIKGIKLVEKENLHITIKFLGEIDEEIVEKIKNLDLSISPIKVKIKNIGVFPNENYIRVIWLGATNLVDLFKEVDEKLSEIGFKKEREYVPHVTIGRVKFIENKKALKDKIEKHRKIDIGEFEVKSIKLMKSTLTPNGPIYEVIKEW